MKKSPVIFKIVREVGISQLAWYAWYQCCLRTGLVRFQTRSAPPRSDFHYPLENNLFLLPDPEKIREVIHTGAAHHLIQEADEIVSGKVRLFGSSPVDLKLTSPGLFRHWTDYSDEVEGGQVDIKFTWEPARFGWAIILGRAFTLTGDDRYAETFWDYTQAFLEGNPPYYGPHWYSAQEVALRLIAFVIAWHIFAGHSQATPEKARLLAWAVASHAGRILPTLSYAHAQNNNHLLVEATGLYTAAVALPTIPESPRWRRLGWHWLNWALEKQIDQDGAYVQQSTNYHRLMLQTALWAELLARQQGQRLSAVALERLDAAAHWLYSLIDPTTGGVPNLGPNDGAYILPLSVSPFRDYRPVAQSASQAFTGERPFDPGPWDEMGLWLLPSEVLQSTSNAPTIRSHHKHQPEGLHVLRSKTNQSWAYLRAARLTARPGHADQLHLDLWWRGLNVAQDAGTYLYNAPLPWENALTHTSVHNTVTVNHQEQMQRAGRFLYLDWAQAQVTSIEHSHDDTWSRITAHHDGYRHLGIVHQRTVEEWQGAWQVEDTLRHSHSWRSSQPVTARLHWLLPDWEWQVERGSNGARIHLHSPLGRLSLNLSLRFPSQVSENDPSFELCLYRAGHLIYGSVDANPIWGWVSPTYGVKIPALSVSMLVRQRPPIVLSSRWDFPTG